MSWDDFMIFSIKATYTGMGIMLIGFAAFMCGMVYAMWKGLS